MSITLSLSALIISFFVLYGFKNEIREKVYTISGHLTVNKYSLSTSYEDTFIEVSDSLVQRLESNPEIATINQFILKAGLLKTKEEVQGILMKGVGADFDTTSFRSQMVKGSFPDFSGEKYSNEIAISQYISSLLEIGIGDKVTLFFLQKPPRYRPVVVSGIYTTGMEEFDEKIIIGDIDLIRRINGWKSYQSGGIEVVLNDHTKIDQMEDELFDSLPVDLDVTSANRQYPQIFEWLELLNRNVLILLIIIVIVAALGMVSMVLILIMERTKMIGILKALGSENSQLRRIFFYSGLNLIIKGLFWGNGVGLVLCWLQFQFRPIPLDVTNYYMHFVPIAFDWLTLMGLNGLMILLVGLTLFIPVRVVSGVQPVEAIRFD